MKLAPIRSFLYLAIEMYMRGAIYVKGGTNHEKGQPVIHSVLSGNIGAVFPVGGAGGFFLGLDHGDAAL